MTPSTSCSKCGAALPGDAPAGLCPGCLMSGGLPPQAGSPHKPWEPPTAEELRAMLPQYEISTMLGRGGMGAVYQGRQVSLDRPVALKVLSVELEQKDQGFAERFQHEARAMAKLNHPGIVTVYDFGETAEGLLYIVMEYVEGTDVARMIASQKRLHTAHAMAITAHVCDALTYAHERGIIHRDIKPANIMVGYDGVVKLADFGLAKIYVEGESGLTHSGMVMGTPSYMAPETITGTSADARADIYAVGVMLYQMLTGKLPRGMFELPSLQVAGLDPRYDGIIAKALRDDPEVRYQSAAEMRAALDGTLTQPVAKVEAEAEVPPAALPTQARPQRPGGRGAPRRPPGASPKKSRRGLILAGIGALAALALGAFFFLDDPEDPPTATPSTPSGLPAAPKEPPSVPAPVVSSAIAAATKAAPFVNSLGMKFVPVPITGGPTNGQRVLFSVWDTRVQDYEAFVKETGREWPTADFEQGPTHPAVMVNLEDATEFCQWLTEHELAAGHLPAAALYRLPSDHEWSCAVGIGEKEDAAKPPSEKSGVIEGIYPWGTEWPPPDQAGNYWSEELRPLLAAGAFPWCKEELPGRRDGYATTSPVGSFPANGHGLYDMGGNVWQWCDDWFNTKQKKLVQRGGSWGGADEFFERSSFRLIGNPSKRADIVGFRCVLAPSGG